MTLVADRASDTSTTTGTGALTLANVANAVTINGNPATTFNTAFTLAGTIAFPISGVGYQITDGTNTETGVGTLTSATNLTRDLIIASSNGGRHVNFIAGTKTVTSTGAWSSAFASATAVPAQTLPENDIQSGTFVLALTNGGAATNVTVRFKVTGSGNVTLSFPTAATNASAGTTVVGTGLPAFLAPTSKSIICPIITNTVTALGMITIAAGAAVQATGTITVLQSTGTSPIQMTGTFTTGVANGIAPTDVTYSLY